MSCLMYQPYASYFPYQRPSASSTGYSDSIKKLHSSLDKSGTDGLYNNGAYATPLSMLGHGSQLSHQGNTHPHQSFIPQHHSSPSHTSTLPHLTLHGQYTQGTTSSMNDTMTPLLPQLKQERCSASVDHRRTSSGNSVHGLSVLTDTRSSNTRENDSQSQPQQQPKDTQFLSANCVILSYFSGDIASSLDEHFTRSLGNSGSRSSSSPLSHGGSCERRGVEGSKNSIWQGSPKPVPMSQRSFPSSFWNPDYQSPAYMAAAAAFGSNLSDAYHFPSFAVGMGAFSQDPWRYAPYSAAQTLGSGYPHHHHHHHSHAAASLHDFSSTYGHSMFAGGSAAGGAGSRFSSSQFPPTLMPAAAAAAAKLGSLAQYDFTKHGADAWSVAAHSRYHSDPFGTSSLAGSHQDPYGLYSGTLSGAC